MAARNWVETDPAWMWLDKIQEGDILLEQGRSERVVRNAHYGKNGKLYSVTFTIKHCSWTGRCYTVLIRADLKTRRFAPTGKKYKAKTELDTKIKEEVNNSYNPPEIKLHCCDVKGVR